MNSTVPKPPKKRYLEATRNTTPLKQEEDPLRKNACSALLQLAGVTSSTWVPKSEPADLSGGLKYLRPPGNKSSKETTTFNQLRTHVVSEVTTYHKREQEGNNDFVPTKHEQPLNLSLERTYTTSQQRIINHVIERMCSDTKPPTPSPDAKKEVKFSLFNPANFMPGGDKRMLSECSDTEVLFKCMQARTIDSVIERMLGDPNKVVVDTVIPTDTPSSANKQEECKVSSTNTLIAEAERAKSPSLEQVTVVGVADSTEDIDPEDNPKKKRTCNKGGKVKIKVDKSVNTGGGKKKRGKLQRTCKGRKAQECADLDKKSDKKAPRSRGSCVEEVDGQKENDDIEENTRKRRGDQVDEVPKKPKLTGDIQDLTSAVSADLQNVGK